MKFLGLEIGSWSELISGIITGLALLYTLSFNRITRKTKFKIKFVSGITRIGDTNDFGLHLRIKNNSQYVNVYLKQTSIGVRRSFIPFTLGQSVPMVTSKPDLYKEIGELIPGESTHVLMPIDDFRENINQYIKFHKIKNIKKLKFVAFAMDRSGRFVYKKICKFDLEWYLGDKK